MFEQPAPQRPRRKVTAHIDADLHAKLVVVKLTTGKTLGELMREGLELIAAHYRPIKNS